MNENGVENWKARAAHFLKTKPKLVNQSREYDVIRQSTDLLEEFENAGFGFGDVSVPPLLSGLADLMGNKKKAEHYAGLFFKSAGKNHYKAAESLAKARFNEGDVKGAAECLSVVPDDMLTRGGINRRNLIDRVRSFTSKSKLAVPLMKGANDTGFSDKDTRKLLDHLPAAKRDGLLHLLRSVDLTTATGEDNAAALPEPAHISLIFAAGFKWSGASAFRDYLADFQHVASPPPAMRYFVDPDFSIGGLYTHLAADDMAAAKREARGFVLEKVLGLNLVNIKPQRIQRKAAGALATLDKTNGASGIGILGARFFEALFSGTDEFPTQAFQDWTECCIESVCPPATKFAVLDSVLRAPDRHLLQLLEKGRMFAVFRDPRDMYTTHVIRGRYTAGIETYIKELRNMMHGFDSSSDSRAVAVQFERFILSQSYREEIGHLAMGGEGVLNDKPKFNPSDSATNIGIHKDFHDQAALERLKETFPELCIDDPFAQWGNS